MLDIRTIGLQYFETYKIMITTYGTHVEKMHELSGKAPDKLLLCLIVL